MVERRANQSGLLLPVAEAPLSPEQRKSLPITVLYGGISSERPGSIESSQTVADLLIRSGYSNVRRVDVAPETVIALADRKVIGIAFLTLHGGFGEDGTIQGLLEMLDIPYTGCGIAASSISADKTLFNQFVRSLGYNAANQVVVSGGVEELSRMEMKFPKVIKPATQGCSYGVFFVKDQDELLHRAAFTQQFSDRMVIEDYIPGRELTAGLFEDPHSDKPHVLPILENVLAREILDYEAKYPGGEHLYEAVVPAQLDPSTQGKIEAICADIFQRLNCHGYVRMDLRLTDRKEVYLLENNTSPGMLSLELSDFPKMLLAGGIDPVNFVDLIVESTMLNYQKKKSRSLNVPSEREMVDYLGLKYSE